MEENAFYLVAGVYFYPGKWNFAGLWPKARCNREEVHLPCWLTANNRAILGFGITLDEECFPVNFQVPVDGDFDRWLDSFCFGLGTVLFPGQEVEFFRSQATMAWRVPGSRTHIKDFRLTRVNTRLSQVLDVRYPGQTLTVHFTPCRRYTHPSATYIINVR